MIEISIVCFCWFVAVGPAGMVWTAVGLTYHPTVAASALLALAVAILNAIAIAERHQDDGPE